MDVKEGVLYKRGEGGLFKRKNWKRRYFQLADAELKYYDSTNGTQKGVLLLAECNGNVDNALEIMPLDCPKTGSSCSTEWRLAISTPARRLYLSCANENEMYEWANAIAHAITVSSP